MRTSLFLLISMAFFTGNCQSSNKQPLLDCLEKATQTDPYRSHFTALEKRLLEKGYLKSIDGQAYRQLAEEVANRNDLLFLEPVFVDTLPSLTSRDCPVVDTNNIPELLQKFLTALDSIDKVPDLSPSLMANTFLSTFEEEDWDQPLTKHFFLAFISFHIIEDKGINVKLPPWSDEEPDLTEIKARNVLPVLVNADNKLFVRGEEIPIDQLKERTKMFIINPFNDSTLAEKPTKAIISLKNDRETNYKFYLEVYNELRAAYLDLWNELCLRKYGYPYHEDLPYEIRKEIKSEIPFILSEAEPIDFDE